jgi:hypothetical protein
LSGLSNDLGFGEWKIKDARMFRLLRVRIGKTAVGKDQFESAFYCLTDDAEKPPVLQRRTGEPQFGRPPASNKGTVDLREKARQEIFARISSDLKDYGEKSDADVDALWVAFKVKTDEHLQHKQLATLPDTFFVNAAHKKKKPHVPRDAVAEVPERLADADGRALEKENLRLQEKVVATEVGCTSVN